MPGPNAKSTPREIVGHHGHHSHGHSILWPALYEHLRSKGMTKRKAAMISNGLWRKKHGLPPKSARVLKRDVGTKERKKLADKGHALPDGSYPIASVNDLRNAIMACGRSNHPQKVKSHIIASAKRLKHPEMIPPSWISKMSYGSADAADRSLTQSQRPGAAAAPPPAAPPGQGRPKSKQQQKQKKKQKRQRKTTRTLSQKEIQQRQKAAADRRKNPNSPEEQAFYDNLNAQTPENRKKLMDFFDKLQHMDPEKRKKTIQQEQDKQAQKFFQDFYAKRLAGVQYTAPPPKAVKAAKKKVKKDEPPARLVKLMAAMNA